MLLRDVLEAPQLRIRPLYVEDDTLDRPVNWTFTTDLADPSRYLIKGQLVMTGLVWRRTAEDTEVFVSAVARSGALALLAGEGLYGAVPEDMVEACRRHELPLFAVPAAVSFAAITAYIANAMANDRVTRVSASLSRQRELLTDVYKGYLLDDLITRTAQELGRPIWVVTATGRHVVTPVEPLPEADLDLIIATALTTPRLPVTINASRGQRLIVFSIAGGSEHRTTAWFLVVAGDWNEWHPLILDTATELTAVAGLYRVQRHGETGVNTALVDRLIELVDADAGQPESAVYLRQVGVGPTQTSIVVVAEFVDHPELQPLALWLLGDAISHLAHPVIGRDGSSRVAAIVSSDGPAGDQTPAVLRSLTTALRRVAPGLEDRVLRVGVSQPAGLGELGGALRSARFALSLPPSKPSGVEQVQISDAEDLTSAVQLLAVVPDHLRRVFVELVLGKVVAHDARYNSQLLFTLTAFLDCHGSWVRTAELTHLHLNTVRYRIGRIEELTGRDLSHTADRADLYLALKLT